MTHPSREPESVTRPGANKPFATHGLAPFVLLLLLGCGPTESLLEPVVEDTLAPTAVADVLDASGAVDPDGRTAFGDAFSLDGARSTDAGGGRIVEYAWSLPDGSVVETVESRLAVTDRVSDPFPPGIHAFALTVTDDSGNESTPVQVTVTVVDIQAPTAVVEVLDASGAVDADGRVGIGTTFSLDGSRSSDVGGQIVGYEWSLPDGTTVETSTPTLAAPDFAPNTLTVGPHTFGLTVADDSGNQSAPVELTVIVVDTRAPTAVLEVSAAGTTSQDGRVDFGTAFSLEGSRSTDIGGRIVRYDWSVPDGRTFSTTEPRLAVTDVVTATFTVGQHRFSLTATDDSGNESSPAQLTVTVVDRQAPTAVLQATDAAGRPLAGDVRIGSAFALSGRRSVDLGGRIVRYTWRFPDGSTVETADPTFAVTGAMTTSFGAGRRTFGLTVTDDSGNESTLAQVSVTVVF